MTIQWETRKVVNRSTHRLNPNGQEVRVASYRPSKGQSLWICITIPPAVMARLRWGAGDMISVGHDETQNLYLRLDPGGFRLVPVGSARKDIKMAVGAPVLSQLRCAYKEGMPSLIVDGYSKVTDQIAVDPQTDILTITVV